MQGESHYEIVPQLFLSELSSSLSVIEDVLDISYLASVCWICVLSVWMVEILVRAECRSMHILKTIPSVGRNGRSVEHVL